MTMAKKRLGKYVLAIFVASFLQNFSKFFEAYVTLYENHYVIRLSWLRRHLTYSQITIWTRVLLIGISPLWVITFLYVKLYKRLRERRKLIFTRQNPTHVIVVSTNCLGIYKLGLFGTLILVLALQFIVTNAYFSVV